MTWYEEKVLPGLINLACGTKPTRKQREKIVPRASGDVLEIGIGSGLNLPFYDRNKVRHVWGLEPSAGMRRLASKAIARSALDVELIDLPGEEIPLDNDSVDTVLVTYTLCTIPEVAEALHGMRRVLKPAGRLLFCEHGKAPDSSVQKWQDRLNPAWKKVAGGCNMNRDIVAILQEAGFLIEDDNRMYIPGLKPLTYNYWGAARIR
ncbi:MAG: class I SAM-dependent methyltransferase [Gammaproteobacteria bacterium]|nr:class I SAM-dependent methyltransferase [Gammaproteobacteria bacterium]MDH3490738.1 class I SAM-dependent methyltransferase [Gammaproteobacteria bacterium]